METKHTPEPWEEYAGNIRTVEANEKYGDGYRAEFRRRPIADVVNIRGQEEVNKANAQRIVACVNACRGINPEAVPDLLEALELFLADPQTKGVVVVGEIGGAEEEEVAALVGSRKPDKPVVALIVGRHAPAERRMGHAGALTTDGTGGAGAKIAALESAGIEVVRNAAIVGETMRRALGAPRPGEPQRLQRTA
jgi:hypothetical protein